MTMPACPHCHRRIVHLLFAGALHLLVIVSLALLPWAPAAAAQRASSTTAPMSCHDTPAGTSTPPVKPSEIGKKSSDLHGHTCCAQGACLCGCSAVAAALIATLLMTPSSLRRPALATAISTARAGPPTLPPLRPPIG